MAVIGKIAKICVLQALCLVAVADDDSNDDPHHHHHHRHHHHGKRHNNATSQNAKAQNVTAKAVVHAVDLGAGAAHGGTEGASDAQIMDKIKHLEQQLGKKQKQSSGSALAKGHLNVNGPLPVDFSDRFVQGVVAATGCRATDVELLGAVPVPEAEGAGPVEEIVFRSKKTVVADVEDQAADPESRLARGVLHSFLVAREDSVEGEAEAAESPESVAPPKPHGPKHASAEAVAPEVDMAMPYGDLEPFGREDTAQELTESSVRESNAMVDQLERSEVAEEKRAVFRALTRLRGAAITSYDGIARSQTGNIDDYARTNQWRKEHPVHHLASDEADVQKWAFPDDNQE